MELGLLILRIVVGGLFIGHGAQKLFGWFGGPGIEGTAGFFGSLDYPRPRRMAWLGGAGEFAGGTLLLLGLLTPLAAAAIIGVMTNAAISAHLPNGLWNTEGGFELPLVMAASATTLAFTGPGAFSLDAAIGWNLSGIGWGFLALAVGLLAAGAVLATRRVEEAAATRRPEEEPASDERRAA